MLPTNGWVAIAFQTNNPGSWLMHCHIVRLIQRPAQKREAPQTNDLSLQAWHADDGFAVQFLESASTLLSTDPLPSDFNSQCSAWDSYFPSSAAYAQTDSGI